MKENTYEFQQKPENQKELKRGVLEYLTQNYQISAETALAATESFASIVRGISGVGETAIRAKAETEIMNFNGVYQIYGITFGNILQFIEKSDMIAAEQRKRLYDFYETMSMNLSAEDKIKVVQMAQEHDLKITMLEVIRDVSLGALGIFCMVIAGNVLGNGKRK